MGVLPLKPLPPQEWLSQWAEEWRKDGGPRQQIQVQIASRIIEDLREIKTENIPPLEADCIKKSILSMAEKLTGGDMAPLSWGIAVQLFIEGKVQRLDFLAREARVRGEVRSLEREIVKLKKVLQV